MLTCGLSLCRLDRSWGRSFDLGGRDGSCGWSRLRNLGWSLYLCGCVGRFDFS